MKKFLHIFLLFFSCIGYSQLADNEPLSSNQSIEGVQILDRYDEDSFIVQGFEFDFDDAKEIVKFDPTAKIYIFDGFAELLKQVNPNIVLDVSCEIDSLLSNEYWSLMKDLET